MYRSLEIKQRTKNYLGIKEHKKESQTIMTLKENYLICHRNTE